MDAPNNNQTQIIQILGPKCVSFSTNSFGLFSYSNDKYIDVI